MNFSVPNQFVGAFFPVISSLSCFWRKISSEQKILPVLLKARFSTEAQLRNGLQFQESSAGIRISSEACIESRERWRFERPTKFLMIFKYSLPSGRIKECGAHILGAKPSFKYQKCLSETATPLVGRSKVPVRMNSDGHKRKKET